MLFPDLTGTCYGRLPIDCSPLDSLFSSLPDAVLMVVMVYREMVLMVVSLAPRLSLVGCAAEKKEKYH